MSAPRDGRQMSAPRDGRPTVLVIAGPTASGKSALAAAVAAEWNGTVINADRSEEHTSELQSLMRISYAVFCLKKKKKYIKNNTQHHNEQKLATEHTHTHDTR